MLRPWRPIRLMAAVRPTRKTDLAPFFEPRSVAVIGSLAEVVGLGQVAIRNMLQFGYSGSIYPVNPSYSEVLGLKVYASIDDVAEAVDVAIVITPPATVPGIVEQCAHKGVRAAVVVTENFAEAGNDGAELQQRLVDVGRRTGIRVMGPNTVGLVNTANGFTTVPYFIAYERIRSGGVAYCSQSGFVGPAAQPLEDRAYPVSKMCDIGNKCDVNEVDLLDYLARDPETKVVAMHLEDVKDGRAFMEAARKLVAHKPLLIFKAGRSEDGARASASHTGSLAGSDPIFDAALRQVGAIRVNSWQEYWDLPRLFATQPLPGGNRVAIITLTGGAGVVAVDAAVDAGLALSILSGTTAERLGKLSSRLVRNPVDLGPILSVSEDPFSVHEEAIAMVLDDANVDCAVIAIYAGFEGMFPPVLEMFGRLKRHVTKPVAVWVYGMKLSMMEEMSRQLEAQGLATYLDLETAVKALGAAAHYSGLRSALESA